MSSESGPPWPGFVDALSTVLLMMVFFTLLLVMVVGTLSYVVALKEVTPSASASDSESAVSKNVGMLEDLEEKTIVTAVNKLQEVLNKAAVLTPDDLDKPAVRVPDDEKEVQQLIKEKKLLLKRVAAARARAMNAEAAAAQARKALEEANRVIAASGIEEKIVNTDETAQVPFVTKLIQGMDDSHRIIILYNQLTSTVSEMTKAELLRWVAVNKDAINSGGLSLDAAVSNDEISSSTANSVSFKRLHTLIRILSEEGGIPKERIKFKSVSNALEGTNQVAISLM